MRIRPVLVVAAVLTLTACADDPAPVTDAVTTTTAAAPSSIGPGEEGTGDGAEVESAGDVSPWPVLSSYGSTEFPIATAVRPDDPDDIFLRSVGKPPAAVDVRIVEGEIRLKGPQCFAGYVDPALDAAAFDEDGWFRSGDLGELDAEGNVFVTGRLKDIVIRNAENISALEIEDVLLRHPEIEDVAVIGLPDPRTGERLCAVLVPVGDAQPRRRTCCSTLSGGGTRPIQMSRAGRGRLGARAATPWASCSSRSFATISGRGEA